jgi:hypothetical protein
LLPLPFSGLQISNVAGVLIEFKMIEVDGNKGTRERSIRHLLFQRSGADGDL